MPKVIEVTSREDIETFVKNNSKVIVDFAAESWCIPCQKLKSHYEMVSDRVTDTIWLHADVDINPNLTAEYDIMSVPTLFAYKDGEFVEQVPRKVNTAITLSKYAEQL